MRKQGAMSAELCEDEDETTYLAGQDASLEKPFDAESLTGLSLCEIEPAPEPAVEKRRTLLDRYRYTWLGRRMTEASVALVSLGASSAVIAARLMLTEGSASAQEAIAAVVHGKFSKGEDEPIYVRNEVASIIAQKDSYPSNYYRKPNVMNLKWDYLRRGKGVIQGQCGAGVSPPVESVVDHGRNQRREVCYNDKTIPWSPGRTVVHVPYANGVRYNFSDQLNELGSKIFSAIKFKVRERIMHGNVTFAYSNGDRAVLDFSRLQQAQAASLDGEQAKKLVLTEGDAPVLELYNPTGE